ncbi:MAG TPA: hypothetical protein DCQ98_20645 [Planctomycetaceae bacterium]|nr:hypothetical protein [Planctomycetaceae bacterium]HRE99702.1 hypothetical protein [Pirellulaceae bacterium]
MSDADILSTDLSPRRDPRHRAGAMRLLLSVIGAYAVSLPVGILLLGLEPNDDGHLSQAAFGGFVFCFLLSLARFVVGYRLFDRIHGALTYLLVAYLTLMIASGIMR